MGTGNSSSVSRFHLTAQDIIDGCGTDCHIECMHVLVTGATASIGMETARVLACAGAQVYLLGRNEVKLQAAIKNIKNELEQQESSSGGSVNGFVCDLNSLASIQQFGQKFSKECYPLNVLVLNAGIFNTKFVQTINGLEQEMGVNHIGHAYLTQLLMPKLIAGAPSRVVVVSSELHTGAKMLNYQMFDHMSSTVNDAKKSWGLISAYQQSKLANVLFTRALASRYKDKKITSYSLHPGIFHTESTSGLSIGRFFKMIHKTKTIPEAAATTVYCAVYLGLESESGRYFVDSSVTDRADKWTDDDVNTFWEWTEKIIRERTATLWIIDTHSATDHP